MSCTSRSLCLVVHAESVTVTVVLMPVQCIHFPICSGYDRMRTVYSISTLVSIANLPSNNNSLKRRRRRNRCKNADSSKSSVISAGRREPWGRYGTVSPLETTIHSEEGGAYSFNRAIWLSCMTVLGFAFCPITSPRNFSGCSIYAVFEHTVLFCVKLRSRKNIFRVSEIGLRRQNIFTLSLFLFPLKVT